MSRRQSSGNVRRLPSGRWQARYTVGYEKISAPRTFGTKRAAESFLAEARVAVDRGTWIDPNASGVTLREYSMRWLDERQQLRPRTRELYEGLLRLHILPALGDVELGQLAPARVRTWHASLLKAGKPGRPTVAKAYRLDLIATLIALAGFARRAEPAVVYLDPAREGGCLRNELVPRQATFASLVV